MKYLITSLNTILKIIVKNYFNYVSFSIMKQFNYNFDNIVDRINSPFIIIIFI